MLSQPSSDFFKMLKMDSLLCKARLVSRYRWNEGTSSVDNLNSILTLRDLYLPHLIKKMSQGGYQVEMKVDFIRDDLVP